MRLSPTSLPVPFARLLARPAPAQRNGTRLRTWLGMTGAALALGAAPSVRAQAAPDTAALVRAVGAVLADSVVPRLGDRAPNYVMWSTTPFDSAVAAVLLAVPGLRPPPDRYPAAYERVGTRGFVMEGDTAVVRVEAASHADSRGDITTYIETYRYRFVRDGRGWRYLRRDFVGGADAGPVRGR